VSRVLLHGATVRTLDPGRPVAPAVLVEDGRVAALCDPADAPAGTRHVDLGGGCVVPGFTDAHVHFPTWALTRREVQLDGAGSAEEVARRVAAAVEAAPPGRWVRGFGWAAEGWTPAREQLDAVSGDVPVALLSHDWHSLWLNSAALARAGGDLDTPGGVVERDPSGEPTGVLREASAWRFRDRFSRATLAELVEATRAELPEAAARGVTAIHDKDGMVGAQDVHRALRDEGALTLRVWQSLPAERLDELAALPERAAPPGALLRAGYAKAYMDGTLGSRTARLLDGSGVEVTSRAEFIDIVARAAALDVPVAVHAIGDRAVRDALDAFDDTAAQWRPRGLRHRIEHAQCVAAADFPRFAALDVTASVQPAMATTDRDLAERLWAGRLAGAYAYASLRRAGARLVGGSDAPVEALSPLDGIRAAVLRTADERPPWRPQEALPAEAALAAWTRTPPWLAGEEHVRGRLAPGLAADLVVLDRDPLAGDDALREVRVVATMLAGRWVHGAP
jgi:predicted amidohydrolase YtcJ